MGRARRGSSNLGGEIPGDTAAPAFATLARPTSPTTSSTSTDRLTKPHSKRRKARSLLRKWKHVFFKHTWLTPLIIILFILTLYGLNPRPSNPLHRALFLSYELPPGHRYPLEPYSEVLHSALSNAPTMYGKGLHDITFVAFYTVVLSFTREFLMQLLLRPLAIMTGIRSRAKQSRFMEQAYTAIYFSVFGPFGLYIMSRPATNLWYFDTTAMFDGFPHRKHEAVFKAYYLLQASYWGQQAIVLLLQLEKPRKDFKELVGHHIITLALIALSYRFHFTYIGIAVYITHDISDFFLATSKTLNYLDSFIVGPYFGFFVAVWVYLRHYLNLTFLWAVLTKFRTVGPFELDWVTQQYKCWISQYITFGLLAILQAINVFWLYLIWRIAKNYVLNSVEGPKDDRSDDEDEDETEAEGPSKEFTAGAKMSNHEVKLLRGEKDGQEERLLELNEKGQPVLLLNGEPVEGEDKPVELAENGSPYGFRNRRRG